jgi:hypothetical protein
MQLHSAKNTFKINGTNPTPPPYPQQTIFEPPLKRASIRIPPRVNDKRLKPFAVSDILIDE